MNILEIEDMIKGLPDQALQREAQMPSGRVPQFLVVSEIQRRGDMRKRFQERQPQGTIKDQVIQEGIAAMAPPEPQMQSAMMGMQQPQMAPPMQMAEGRAIPFPDDPRLAELRAQGLTDEQIAQEIRRLGLNEERMAQLGLPTIGTMEATMQPDAYSQDAYADIFARQQGNIPAGMEFIEPRTMDDLLSPQVGFTTREMAQSQTLPNVPVERPAPSQRGIGSAPEGTADALQAQIQALRSAPASPAAQADFAMPDFASYRQTINAALAPPPATGIRSVGNLLGSDMPALSNVSGPAPSPRVAEEILAQTPTGGGTNVVDLINQALAPPPATGDRSVGNLFGSDMPAPSSVDGSAPVSAPPAVDTPDLAAQLIAESQARRGREPSSAVTGGLSDAQFQARNREIVSGLIPEFMKADPSTNLFSFIRDPSGRNVSDSSERAALLESMERIERAKSDAPLIPFLPEGTKSEIIARRRLAEESQARRDREPSAAIGNFEELIDIANNQSSAVQTDGGRGLLTGSATDSEVVETALTRDTSSSLSDRSTTVDEKDTSRGGTAGESVQGTGSRYLELEGLRNRQAQIAASDVGFAGQEAARGLSFAELLRTRERPELSYEGLASKYQEQMESQLDEIKNERGAQALIALGAGIARGDLGAGLSDAGKAVATSNAQRRALQARQQAIQMGLEKSQIDAAFANQVKKEQDQIDAMRFEIDTLNKLGVAVNKSEQTILNFDLALESKLASLASTDRYRDQQFKSQDALNRRAALDFVTDSMREMGLAGKSDEAISNVQDILLQKAARTLNISVAELTKDEEQEEESDDQVISFDEQGKRI